LWTTSWVIAGQVVSRDPHDSSSKMTTETVRS